MQNVGIRRNITSPTSLYQQLASVMSATTYFDIFVYNPVVPGIVVKLDVSNLFNVERPL
jgi:hypothetical protein